MARLAAKEKVLFYPTPMEIMDLIAANLKPGAPGTILDPCAGTGAQVAYLGHLLSLERYGCELHPERFEEASTRLNVCLNGAREYLDVEGKFSMIFDNPPYDRSISGERMEVSHLRLDLDLLMTNGVGVFVIPVSIIDFELCQLLVMHLLDVQIRKFPEPYFSDFSQVVIFGIKRREPASYTYSKASELEQLAKNGLPDLQEAEFAYALPETIQSIDKFELQFVQTHQILYEVGEQGIQTLDQFEALTVGTGGGVDHFQPVLQMTAGHTALAIAAGIVDGTEVKIDGESWIIKGSTTKRIKVITDTDTDGDGNTSKKIRKREQLVQQITAFNLQNGTLQEHNSLDDKEGFGDFLLTHQDALVRMIQEKYPPMFEPDRDMPNWVETLQRVQAPGKLPGRESNGLLPAQQVRAAALAKRLETSKSVILVGEMGVGKTACSQAIAALIGTGNWKLVVVCPSPIAAKWAREAKTVLALFDVGIQLIGERRKQPDGAGKTRKIAKPVLDVIRAMDEDKPSILVMSYEVAKNGPKWIHAPAQQRRMLKYRIEVEERFDTYPYKRMVEKVVTKFENVLCCPSCGFVVRHAQGYALRDVKELGKKKHWCQGRVTRVIGDVDGREYQTVEARCNEPLFRQVPFSYGGRVAIADFLNRHYSGRYNLILDEAHSTKGGDTDVGYASMDLISGAQKVIAMTGTLYAGKASTIFYLLYRLFDSFRQVYSYTDVQRFIENHGLQETITTIKADRTSYHSSYGYARVNERTRELPGVSPAMVTSLLNDTAFLKLADVGFVLPSYTEERIPIPVDDRLEAGLDDLQSLYSSASEFARKGNPGLLSAWLYAALGWVDCPIDETLTARDKDGSVLGTYTIEGALSSAEQLLDEPLAKDEILLDLIESELDQGRGCGVYFAQVNRRNWMERIQKQLAKRGIYAEILRQDTCKAADREAWYREFVVRCRGRGQEPVLLANGSLVKEGLDLIELPTLIETGVEYKINDLRQRDRRSWRLTQDRPVRVVFLYYEDTMQQTALQLVAAKLKAALLVDGSLSDGLAAMDVDDGNLMDALMRAVAQKNTGKAVEWSGMQITSTETNLPSPQPALPEFEEPKPTLELEIVQIVVGEGMQQLGFADMFEVTSSEVAKLKTKKKQRVVKKEAIEFKRVGDQYAFI